MVTGIALLLAQLSTATSESHRQKLCDEALSLVEKCGSDIRALTFALHPPVVENLGLFPALCAFVEGFQQRTRIMVQLEVPAALEGLDSNVTTAILHIAQEAFLNIYRHSGSSTAHLSIRQSAQAIELTISDKGHGIAHGRRSLVECGFYGVGISSMRERAEHLGGRLIIESDDSGTKLFVNLPLVTLYDADKNTYR